MQSMKDKGSRRLWKIGIIILIIIALLFWLEWLGGERALQPLEQPLPYPPHSVIES